MMTQHDIRREFRKITSAVGLGTAWVPRELRHTFVSMMSSGGVRWRRSRGWLVTGRPARPSWFTAASCAR
jgi:hypothetical protein